MSITKRLAINTYTEALSHRAVGGRRRRPDRPLLLGGEGELFWLISDDGNRNWNACLSY
jgi:hypothetical protein